MLLPQTGRRKPVILLSLRHRVLVIDELVAIMQR